MMSNTMRHLNNAALPMQKAIIHRPKTGAKICTSNLSSTLILLRALKEQDRHTRLKKKSAKRMTSHSVTQKVTEEMKRSMTFL